MRSLPQVFNAATHFVDRHLAEGRGEKVAIECADERVTYREVAERVNRFGSALRSLGIQPEQRIALILQDTPAFAYAFFGAIKAGFVPIPLNTLWRARDYQHALNDSGASALVISDALLQRVPGDRSHRAASPRARDRRWRAARRLPQFRCAAGAIVARPRCSADATGRNGVLVVLVRKHRRPQRLRASAAGHVGVRRVLREGCAGHAGIRPLLQRGQAVLRLWPRQRACTCRSRWVRRQS